MIDNESDPGAWQAALAPIHPSLKVLTDAELHCAKLIAKVQQTHGTKTMREALELVAAEKKRRTEIATWNGKK